MSEVPQFDLKDGRWDGMQWRGEGSCGFGGDFDSIDGWWGIHPDWWEELERLARIHGGLTFGDDDYGMSIRHINCTQPFHVYWHVTGSRKKQGSNNPLPNDLFALLNERAKKQRKYKFILSKTTAPSSCNFEPFEQGLEEDAEFRSQLRRNFDEGLKQYGKGALICNETHGNLSYVTLDEFLEGAKDCLSKQLTKVLINACHPDRQIVVIASLDKGLKNDTYSYQAFLINVSREVQS